MTITFSSSRGSLHAQPPALVSAGAARGSRRVIRLRHRTPLTPDNAASTVPWLVEGLRRADRLSRAAGDRGLDRSGRPGGHVPARLRGCIRVRADPARPVEHSLRCGPRPTEQHLFGSSLADSPALVVEHTAGTLPPSALLAIAHQAQAVDSSHPATAPADRASFALPLTNIPGLTSTSGKPATPPSPSSSFHRRRTRATSAPERRATRRQHPGRRAQRSGSLDPCRRSSARATSSRTR